MFSQSRIQPKAATAAAGRGSVSVLFLFPPSARFRIVRGVLANRHSCSWYAALLPARGIREIKVFIIVKHV